MIITFGAMNKVEGLTLTTPKSYPRDRYGDIFMEGNQDMSPTKKPQAVSFKEQGPTVEQIKERVENIKTPDVKAFAREFQKKLAAKPLGEWDTSFLEQEYLRWVNKDSILTAQSRTFEETPSAEMQPFIAIIMEELEHRNVDLKPLFEKATAQAAKEGHPIKSSVGAATGMTEGEFNQAADQLLTSINIPQLRSYIEASKLTPPQQMPELYRAIYTAYSEIHSTLVNQIIGLPDTPEGIRQKALLEPGLKDAERQFNSISILMRAKTYDRRMDEEEIKRVNEIFKLKRELNSTADPLEKQRIKELLKTEALSLLDSVKAPEDEPLADDILKAIGADEVATEKFISRLIVSTLENESYQMRGFYGPINQDKFLKVNEKEIGEQRIGRLRRLIEANSAFHNMNYIVKRSFDQFAQQAQSLLPSHFEVLSKVPGVDVALHLYERFYQEELGTETRITQEGLEKIEKEVRDALHEVNDKNVIEGFVGRQLEEWEVSRALIYGRNLFRVMVRAAEHVSHSQLQDGSDVFTSPPQKELSQILNSIKYVVFRFKPNESAGGLEIIKEVLRKRTEKRRSGEKIRIKTLQGTDVDMRDLETIINARGVMATWRNAQALLKEIKFRDGANMTNVVEFWERHKQEISTISSKDEARALLKPLIENNSLALGVLVSGWGENVPAELKEILWEKIAELNPLVMSSLLSRLEIDTNAKGHERLTGVNGVKSLEDILLKTWGTPQQRDVNIGLGNNRAQIVKGELRDLEEALKRFKRTLPHKKEHYTDRQKNELKAISQRIDAKKSEYSEMDKMIKDLLRNEKWTKLKVKLSIANEKRIKYAAEHMGEAPKSLDTYLQELNLSPEEMDVCREITENGKKIASDLSNMKTASTWFLDDTPFALMNWEKLGQFYDRQTGDLGNFQKSSGALLKIIAGLPFGEPPQEIIKAFAEAITSAGDVLGREAAQDNFLDVQKQYFEMIYEHPKYRQALISAFRHSRFLPTSRAQEITGSISSPSVNEEGLFEVLENSLHAHNIRKLVKDKEGNVLYSDIYEELEKEYKLGWWDRIIKKNLRDVGPIGIFSLIIAFFKGTFKELKAA